MFTALPLQAPTWMPNPSATNLLAAVTVLVVAHAAVFSGQIINYARGVFDREMYGKADSAKVVFASALMVFGSLFGILSWLWVGYAVGEWAGFVLLLPVALTVPTYTPSLFTSYILPMAEGAYEPPEPEPEPSRLAQYRQNRRQEKTADENVEVFTPEPDSTDGALSPEPENDGSLSPDPSAEGEWDEGEDEDDDGGLFGRFSGGRKDHL